MTENNATVTPLTPKEEAALREMGLLQGGLSPADRATLYARTQARRTALLQASLTLEDAATRLGVSVADVERRLQDRTLYGFEHRGAMLVPSFQFTGKGELPGLAEVLPQLDKGMDPLSVDGFFHTPQVDLEISGQRVTPVTWLARGRKPALVAELAKYMFLGM